MTLYLIIITLLSTAALLLISKKTGLLKDVKNQKHKSFVSKKNNHILGGIVFIVFWVFYIFFDQKIIFNELKIFQFQYTNFKYSNFRLFFKQRIF